MRDRCYHALLEKVKLLLDTLVITVQYETFLVFNDLSLQDNFQENSVPIKILDLQLKTKVFKLLFSFACL